MKKTLLVLAAAALSAQVFAFDSEAALKPEGAVGQYTKVEYQITEKFGDYYRSPRAKFLHVFDASGKETEASELTSKDSLVDHIAYKYEGENLVASGVHMQACSVDDDCESLAFNVYAYNVQPGVEIDYATGENEKE